MVNVKANGAIEIPYSEAKQALSDLYNYITKDKRKICEVLDITLQTVVDWWSRSFVKVFNTQIMKEIDDQSIPQDELKSLLRNIGYYIEQTKYPDIVEESVRCLQKLCDDKDDLSNKSGWKDKIRGKLYIDEEVFTKVEELKKAEADFKNLALNMKADFMDHRILLQDPDSLTAADISDTKRLMNEQRAKIIGLVSDIRKDISCPGQTIKLLSKDQLLQEDRKTN